MPDTTRLTTCAPIPPPVLRAVVTAEEQRRPVLVEVLIEREANAAMGAALDAIVEFEAADREPAEATATVGA